MSAFIDAHRERFGVELICRTIDVSASAYYQRATGARSTRDVEDERLLEVIKCVHRENFEAYGYRRMWKALHRAGEPVARCQVQRLMARASIQGAKRRGRPWRTTTPGGQAERRADLVQRDFTASAPDRLWSAISPICAAGRAWCSLPSCSMSTAGGSWAGSSPPTCAPSSFKTRCAWRWPSAHPAPTSR